jgi:hypothetical protein
MKGIARTALAVRALLTNKPTWYSRGMDIGSPFVVVSVIFGTFLACILWATRGSAESHQPHEGEAGHPPTVHEH